MNRTRKTVSRSKKMSGGMRVSKNPKNPKPYYKRFSGFMPKLLYKSKPSSRPAASRPALAPAPKKLTKKQLRKIIQNSRNFNAQMNAMVKRHQKGLKLQKQAELSRILPF